MSVLFYLKKRNHPNEGHFSMVSLANLRSEKRLEMIEPLNVVAKCMKISNLNSGKVLDIGTGTGLFAEFFQNCGFNVTGIDDSEIMIKEARRLVPSGYFTQASAENIPFEDNEFEISLFAHVLHEIPNQEEVLQEAKRVTKSHVFVLEWPYRSDRIGPPLEQRIDEKSMIKLFKKSGLGKCQAVQVKDMVLYFSN